MSESVVQIACFDVAGECYALPVAALREIVRLSPISRLPDSPALVEGLIDLRGRLIPVVDLARVIGTTRHAPDDEVRIAVVASSNLLIGLCVDAATEVLSVDESDYEAVPAVAKGCQAAVVDAVIRREGQAPVMVLSIEGLLAAVSASGAPEVATGEAA